MRRVGRHLVMSVVDIEVPWAATRLDPNGYYAALGLDPNRPHLMSVIRKAYLRKMRVLHPDVAERYDDTEYRRVQVAYRVLSNPAMRRRYDALMPGERFFDEFTPLFDGAYVPLVVEDAPKNVDSVSNDYENVMWSPVVYLYDDVVDVDDDDVTAWVSLFVVAWSEVMPGEVVRVGFGRTTRLDWRPWGVVTVVPMDSAPSYATAAYLVRSAAEEIRQKRRVGVASSGMVV